MTTITIEVTDEQARLLSEEASRLHTTAEELAARKIIEALGEARLDFHDVARQVIQENAELYRRLA